MSLHTLIRYAIEDMMKAAYGKRSDDFKSPANTHTTFVRKWRQEESRKKENTIEYYKREALEKDFIITHCLRFVSEWTPEEEILPFEAKQTLVLAQLSSVLLVKTCFSDVVQKCKRVSPKLDNLDCLGIMFNLLLSHAHIRYYTSLAIDKYPIKFINTFLSGLDMELCSESQIKHMTIEATPSPDLAALITRLRRRIETDICLSDSHQAQQELSVVTEYC